MTRVQRSYVPSWIGVVMPKATKPLDSRDGQPQASDFRYWLPFMALWALLGLLITAIYWSVGWLLDGALQWLWRRAGWD